MATPRDPAVTDYIRWRMRSALESGEHGTGAQIAKRIGISPSMLSQLDKTGVGGRSIDGFATFLGFKDAEALRMKAYDWYREQTPKTSARAEDPAVKEALESVKALHPAISEGQLRTILHRFAHEDFDGRDAAYWLATLMQEIAQDAIRDQRRRAEQGQQRLERAREQKAIQNAFRSAATVKKQAEEQQAVDELEAVPDPPKVEHHEPKKRKRRA